MSHVPNISFREAATLGAIGTLGQTDPAAPDNPFLPLRTRGVIDRCSAADPSLPAALPSLISPDDAWLLYWSGLSGAQARQAAQAYRLPTPLGSPARLTQQDFLHAAGVLKCEVAAVKAIAELESRGSGFLPDGRPRILFEAHWFSRLTARVHDKLYPTISSPYWKKEFYLGGAREYDRLMRAIQLDARAAIRSASWGAFQIMGFNHAEAGHAAPEDFVAAMYKSEGEHLKAFVAYVQNRKLAAPLREKNWEAVARGFNGPKYKENDYDARLARAYAKHAGAGPGSKGK